MEFVPHECFSTAAGGWTAFDAYHVKLSGLPVFSTLAKQKHNFHVLQLYSPAETALFIVTVFLIT